MAKKKDTKYKAQDELLGSSIEKSNKLNLSEEARLKTESAILDRKIKTNAQLDAYIAKLAKVEAIERRIVGEKTKAKATEKASRASSEAAEDFAKRALQIKQDTVTAAESDYDLAASAAIAAKKQTMIDLKNGVITQDRAYALREMIVTKEKELEVSKKAGVHAKKANDIFQDAVGQSQGQVQEFLGSFPGGEALGKVMGVDKIFEKVGNAGKEAINAATEAMIAGKGPMAAMKAGQAAFNATAMMNPYVAIAAAILIVIGLIYQQNKAIKEQAKAQGVSVAQAKQQIILAKEAGQTSAVSLATSKDILATQNKINDALGTSLAINAQNAAQVAEVGLAFGMGAEAAAETAGAFMQVGASQEEVANIMKEGNLAAAQAGVDMGKVQKDIAENAGKMNKYFAGSPKLLQKAAIEAQKIGMSLESMAKMSEGLLDIESSLQAQFEFQAFTGKQINLDKARQLALEGDIAGASKEVMENIGDINDFENMTMKQREKLAKMTGMELGDLEKSLRIQSLRGKMTDEELAQAQGLNLSAAELKDMTAEQLAEKLKSQQATDKMAATFMKLKDTVMLALQPLMDTVGVILDELMPVLDIAGMLIKNAFLPVKLAAKILGFIVGVVIRLIQPLLDVMKAVTGIFDGTTSFKELLKTIGYAILDSIFAPFRLVYAFLGQIFGWPKNFGKVIMGLGAKIYKFLFGPIDEIKELFASIGPKIKEAFMAPINWVKDKIKGMLPGWAKRLLFGKDKTKEAGADKKELSARNQRQLDNAKERLDNKVITHGGSIEDGVIQKGKIISTDPADTITATKEGGGFLSKIGDMASKAYSMSPMGMATDALGITGDDGLFGGGGGKDEQLEVLKQILLAVQTPPPVVVGDEQVVAIGNKVSARKSMMG